MRRGKRIGFAVTAVMMFFCLLLSSTDILIKEGVEEVKKISVCVASENSPYTEDLKRGILEIAMENRVDVNYVTALDENGEDAYAQLKHEREGGAQAIILFADHSMEVWQFLKENPADVPVVAANTFGDAPKSVPDISFDVNGAANELADAIQKQHGAQADIILLTGTEGISVEIGQKLYDVFWERGIQADCMEGTKEQLKKAKKEKENPVFVGCFIFQTEQAAEHLEGDTLYGIGYSDQILRRILEGRIEGIEAFSMYSMGICAMRQAVALIERDRTEHVQISCKLITRENLEEEEEFLIPIH